MRLSFFSIALAVCAGTQSVSAATIPLPVSLQLATEAFSPNATEAFSPDATEAFSPDATEAFSPDATEAFSPDATEAFSPDATEAFSPDATEAFSPDATEAFSPDATEAFSPDATEAFSPDATEALSPDATDAFSTVATKAISTAEDIIAALAPALPLSAFSNTFVKLLTLEEVLAPGNVPTAPPANESTWRSADAADAQCSNPRVRVEWDTLSTANKNAFIKAVQCLQRKRPSGKFAQARTRYEDLVALHQTLTPNVHSNAKFLIWHRYYLWTFEDILRTECGFKAPLPWWDETKYSGNFAASSVFSAKYFGSINTGGNCVTDGQFAGLTLNVGPGTGNGAHCLARNNDDSKTVNTNANMVNGCNARHPYSNMASCAEGGAHAWGHNGIGAVMLDVYASPGDPVFFLHHAFIDRNFRRWQNGNSERIHTIDGTDKSGNALTMDTVVSVKGMRPDVHIRNIMDTLGKKLCYKYDY